MAWVMPELDALMVELSSTAVNQVDGHGNDGRVYNVGCARGNGCDTVEGTVAQVMPAGGLSTDGRIVSMAGETVPAFPDRDWLVVSKHSLAGIDSDHDVYLASDWVTSIVVPMVLKGEPVAVVGHYLPQFVPTEYVVCVLDTWGQIGCEGDGRWSGIAFDDGPYQRLEGFGRSLCAQRLSDDVVECFDGTVVDWGPLVALSVAGFQYRAEGQYVYWSDDDYDPPICAITIDDEVRCQGDYFAPEFLHALADL